MAEATLPPLDAADAARLTEFARACRAAARAVMMYPAGHPAIVTTLGRIVQVTSTASLPAPMKITVHANTLQIDGRSPARIDAAIGELAALLHDHLIGELTVNAGGDTEAWRNFLLILGKSTDDIRAEGGIARLWSTTAGTHVGIREIDYSEVLKERRGGDPAKWENILATCLEGDKTVDIDDEAAKWLLEVAGDEVQLGNLFAELESRSADVQLTESRAAAFARLMQGIVAAAKKINPEGLDTILRNMAGALGRLSPEMMVSLLAHAGDATSDAANVINDVVARMSEQTIASFVARNVTKPDTSLDRVAQAFHTLVRDEDQQQRLLALAHDEAAAGPMGATEGFEDVWNSVAHKLITSYTDKPYVSDAYARELSTSRAQAVTIDQVSDDPPERLTAWLGTVATSELRKLDITLVMDLLTIEKDDQLWGNLMPPVVSLMEDLMLVGDFEAATELGGIITAARESATQERRQHAMIAIDMLISGSMMRNMITHVAKIDEKQFERLKTMCKAMGDVLVRPLADAVSTNISDRTRERLTAILIAFGPAARLHVERMKASDNAAVRRTALYLLSEFGGSDALPDLKELLNDSSAQIQREAVRAIVAIGSDKAFDVLYQALATGSAQSRDVIMKALAAVRHEKAAPMFGYLMARVDHKGPLGNVYLSAVEGLGQLKDPTGVPPLKAALYRGEWWAPRRTSVLRNAAAAALARIGSPEAVEVLEEAMTAGPRGVRSAVRPHVDSVRARRASR